MMLKQLVEYLRNIKDYCPPNYEFAPVKWIININPEGEFLGFVQQVNEPDNPKDKGKKIPIPALPNKRSGIAPDPRFLVDNAEYVLGIDNDNKSKGKKSRALELHRRFLNLLKDCYKDTRDNSINAVIKLLENNKDKIKLPEKHNFGDLISFYVEGDDDLVCLKQEIVSWWSNNAIKTDKPIKGICSCCGQETILQERLPQPIKKIGGQSSGPMLISINERAYESYKLPNAINSSICYPCGEAFGKSLNYLIENKNNSIRIGNLTYVFWSLSNPEFSVLTYLSQPKEEDVKQLFQSAIKGRNIVTNNLEDFQAIALNASSSRVIVRDFIETTISKVEKSLTRWFQMMYIKNAYDENKYYSIYKLSASLYKRPKDNKQVDIDPIIPTLLLKCAINSEPIPYNILYLALKRNRVEQKVTDERASLIKLVLLSNKDFNSFKEDEMTELDINCKVPAYLIGRLFALLERIQKVAIKGAKSTIIDRYFGSASSNPASVFGLLLKLSQHHLSKIRKDNERYYKYFDRTLTEILADLKEFPSTLNLKEQAMFALGYYHQKHFNKQTIKEEEGTDLSSEGIDNENNEFEDENGGLKDDQF